ncbi:MAG: preprotein translocase subunit SecG [Lactobacillaceae bacterium]|jgi:preprotein translocase subunit SecG|nr:preprotein translocase subunit SecG [Lactobacillaceae bacterium]
MENVLLTTLIVLGIFLIILIMMQPSKQQDVLNGLTGGAGDLFSNQKARGFEAILKHMTAVLGIVWMILALILMYVDNH